MDNFIQLIDLNHINDLVKKLEQELVPMLDQYRYELNTAETQQKIQREIAAYFTNRWVEHAAHNVRVDVGPNNGLIVTAVVAYPDEHLGDFNIDEYEIDYYCNNAIDIDVDKAVQDDMTIPSQEPRSPDDILFEPIVKKKEPTKDDSVLDDFFDDMSCVGRDKLIDVLKAKPQGECDDCNCIG